MATSAIGVDLGNDTLKATRLSLQDGKYALTGLGFQALGEIGHMPESSDRRLAVAARFQQMIRDAGLQAPLFSPPRVNFGLAGAKVSFRFLQTIPVPRPLLEKKVAFEVAENITAKSKVALSYNYRILDTPQQDQTTALIGLAVESEIEAVRAECRQAQLGETAIDFAALGLFNSYLYGHGPCFRSSPPAADSAANTANAGTAGDAETAAEGSEADAAAGDAAPAESEAETVALVDIGAAEIKILICHGDDLYFIKANAGGGLRFSQSLAKLLNVGLFEAEAAKCEDADVTIEGHTGNTLRLTRTAIPRPSDAQEAKPGPAAPDPGAAISTDDSARNNWLEEAAGEAAPASAASTDAAAGSPATNEPSSADALTDDPAAAPASRDTVIVENTDPLTPAALPGSGPDAGAENRVQSKYLVGRRIGDPPAGSGARPAPTTAGAASGIKPAVPAAPASEAIPGPVSLTTASGGTLIDPAALDSGESILNTEPPAEKTMAPEDPAAAQQRQRRISNLLVREAAAICANIESAVQFCRQQNRIRQLRLDRVLITGGGTRLKGLAGYMQRRLRLPVENLDPFRQVQISLPEHQFELLRQERDRLAVPIGLALGVLQTGAAHMPVITQTESARKQLLQRTLYLYYAAVLVVAVVALGYFFSTRHNRAYASYYTQVQNHYKNAVQSQKDLEKKMRDLELIRRETNAVELRVNSGSFIADLLTTLKSKEISQDNIWFTEIATVAPDFYHRAELKEQFAKEDEILFELRQLHINAHLLRDKRLFLRGFCKSTADPTKAREEAHDNIASMVHKISKDHATTPQEKELALFDQAWLIYEASANAKDLPKSSKNLLVKEFVIECRLYEKKTGVMETSVLPPAIGGGELVPSSSSAGAGAAGTPKPPPPSKARVDIN